MGNEEEGPGSVRIGPQIQTSFLEILGRVQDQQRGDAASRRSRRGGFLFRLRVEGNVATRDSRERGVVWRL